MPQVVILRGQNHNFPANTVGGNLNVATNHPASGNVTYTVGAGVPIVAPLPGGSVYSFVLPVNGHTATIINNTTSGLSCLY